MRPQSGQDGIPTRERGNEEFPPVSPNETRCRCQCAPTGAEALLPQTPEHVVSTPVANDFGGLPLIPYMLGLVAITPLFHSG